MLVVFVCVGEGIEHAAVARFERLEKGVFFGLAALYKGDEVGVFYVEPCICAAQQLVTVDVEVAVVDIVFELALCTFKLLLVQKALLVQIDKVYKIGVARSARNRLVGRIAVTRLLQGKNLPVLCSILCERIDKFIRFLAERTYSVFVWQRGDVAKHARTAGRKILLHICTSDLSVKCTLRVR